MPSHIALLRGVNNLGGKMVAMADLRSLVASLGFTEVTTYIQSGNVLFTPPAAGGDAVTADAEALAADLEHAIADGLGLRVRAVVLSGDELGGYLRGNPYPAQANPRLLHAIFLPEPAGARLTAWVEAAVRESRSADSTDEAVVIGRAVYLHTPDGFPASALRRAFARSGGPTSPAVAGTARNWATVTKLADLLAG